MPGLGRCDSLFVVLLVAGICATPCPCRAQPTSPELTPAQHRAVEKAFRLRLEAADLWASHQRDKALERAAQIVSLYRDAFAGSPREEAIRPIDLLAYWQARRGKYAAAAQSEQAALAARRKLYQSAIHPEVVTTRANLSYLNWMMGLKPEDQKRVEQAVRQHEDALVRAAALGGSEYLNKSIAAAKALHDLYQTLGGTSSISYLMTLDGLGAYYLELSTVDPKWEQATREALREAVEGSRALLGPKHPGTATRMRSYAYGLAQLGNLHWQSKDYPRARQLFEKARDIWKEFPAPDSWQATGLEVDIAFLKRLEGKKREDRQLAEKAVEDFYKSVEQFQQAGVSKNKDLMKKSAAAADAALATFKKIFDDQNRLYLTMLDVLVGLYADLEESASPAQIGKRAEELRQEGIRISAKLYVANDPVHVARMNAYAGFLAERAYDALEENHIDQAVKDREEAVRIWKAIYGDGHWQTKAGIIDLQRARVLDAATKDKQELFATAIEQLQKARRWTGKDFSVSSTRAPAGASPMGKKPRRSEKQVGLQEAIQAMKEALEGYRKIFGEEDVEVETAELGFLYQVAGDFSRAEPCLIQAKELCKKQYGETHPYYAARLVNLADLYADMGQFSRELVFREQALKIHANVARDMDYANDLKDLSLLYYNSGQLFRAEAYLREFLEVVAKAEGMDSEIYVRTLRDYAVLLMLGGYSDTAEQFLVSTCYALRLRQKQNADDLETASDYGQALHTLGLLYEYEGRRPLAAELRSRGREELKRGAGDDFPDGRSAYADMLLNEATIAFGRGADPDAERDAKEAVDLLKDSDRSGEAQATLAKVYFLQKKPKKNPLARKYFIQSLKREYRDLQHALAVTSERQHFALVNSMSSTLDRYVQFSAEAGLPADETYTRVLEWKGAVLAHQYQRRLQQQAPKVVEDMREAARLNQRDRLEDLQRRLAADQPELKVALKAATPEDIRKVLPPNAALIDFFQYAVFTRFGQGEGTRWKIEERMGAFVVRPGQPTVWINLGLVRPIVQAVRCWRIAIGVEKESTETVPKGPPCPAPAWNALPWSQPGLTLQKLLWSPLRQAVGEAKMLFISPDGVLSGFPFAALPTEEGQPESYLIRSRQVAMVSAAQLLPRYLSSERMNSGGKPSLLLVGDINYDASPGKPFRPRSPLTRRDPAVVFPQSDPIRGSKNELKKIDELFKAAFPGAAPKVLSRDKATEQAFRDEAPGTHFLMLSTHGWYAGTKLFPNQDPALAEDNISFSFSFRMDRFAELTGPNPWQTCAVALAGANQGAKISGI